VVLDGGANTWIETDGATKIDLATAKSFYDQGVLFIDVSTEAEGLWKEGHIPGVVNLPLVEYDPTRKRFRETTLSEVADKTEAVFFTGVHPELRAPLVGQPPKRLTGAIRKSTTSTAAPRPGRKLDIQLKRMIRMLTDYEHLYWVVRNRSLFNA